MKWTTLRLIFFGEQNSILFSLPANESASDIISFVKDKTKYRVKLSKNLREYLNENADYNKK